MPSTIDRCPHCGEALAPHVVELGGKRVDLGYFPCDCPEAVAEAMEAEEEEREREREAKEAREDVRLERMGVPKRYRRLDHPRAEEIACKVTEGRWAYIHGPNGTCKSTLAYAVARRLESGSAYCIASYDLMDAMRIPSERDQAAYDKARMIDYLVIDDLGKEATATPYACERLFSIIDTRSKEMRPTVITSNYRLGDLARSIPTAGVGVAIASRIKEDAEVVELSGDDRRLS